MKLIVISAETDRTDEIVLVRELFARGLERLHLRKPRWSVRQLEAWIDQIPHAYRRRLVLHSHHALVRSHGLGGAHWPDDKNCPSAPPSEFGLRSRACHDLASLGAALGTFDTALCSPVFASFSKPGHGPSDSFNLKTLTKFLGAARTFGGTEVFALGGIDASNTAECHRAGFDGVAVLGAVWKSLDPLRAFDELREACDRCAGSPASRPRSHTSVGVSA